MISIKRGENDKITIRYVSSHGNVFSLKSVAKSMLAQQYKMLEKYVPDGVYTNEILEVMASLFSVHIKDQQLTEVLLKNTTTEIEKLRVSE